MFTLRRNPARALEVLSALPLAVAGTAALLTVFVSAGLLLRLSHPWTPRV